VAFDMDIYLLDLAEDGMNIGIVYTSTFKLYEYFSIAGRGNWNIVFEVRFDIGTWSVYPCFKLGPWCSCGRHLVRGIGMREI